MRMFLRPRWIVSHVIVLAILVAFVNLGMWQLRRLAERRAEIQQISQNMAGAARPLAEVLAQYGNDPDALPYRRVIVSGRYRPADEVLLTPRSNGRRAGHHVVTPLVLADGQAVLVDRGWVPFEDDDPPIEQAAPPDGEVTVEGILLPTQEATRYGAPGGGDRITYLSSVDVDVVQPQVGISLYPFWVQLQSQRPAPDALPLPGVPPERDEGPHQSYAWQWFSFAAILLVGYPLLLRRSLYNARAPRRQPEVD